jgi:hypothetical protein
MGTPLFPVPPEGGIPLPPITTPPVIVEPGGVGADPSSVTAAIGSVLAYIKNLSTWLQGYTNALFSQILAGLSAIFHQILAFFQYLAQTWLGHLLGAVWARVVAIYKAISAELGYIIRIIKQYEAMVSAWEEKIFRPILNLIQRLRSVLLVFRLFHFKFAAKLDAFLAAQESKLTFIWATTRRDVSRIIDYLNLIFDPFGYFQPAIYLASAVRSVAQLLGIEWGAQVGILTAAQQSTAAARSQFYTASNQKTYMAGIASGAPDPDDTAIVQAQLQGYADLGYKT